MKGLNTLIKLHKRKVDELRRKMGSLENQKSQLRQTSVKLQEELQREVSLAAKQPEMAGFFGGFAKRIQNRQKAIADEIKKLDAEMAKLQFEVAEAFGELKKYEIARDNAKARVKEDENRQETIELDDVAGTQYRRKEKENS